MERQRPGLCSRRAQRISCSLQRVPWPCLAVLSVGSHWCDILCAPSLSVIPLRSCETLAVHPRAARLCSICSRCSARPENLHPALRDGCLVLLGRPNCGCFRVWCVSSPASAIGGSPFDFWCGSGLSRLSSQQFPQKTPHRTHISQRICVLPAGTHSYLCSSSTFFLFQTS